jgi:serine acetyltransferase
MADDRGREARHNRSKCMSLRRGMILKGFTIGADAVVGAGAFVTRDVPPQSVMAGNPARVTRELKPAGGVWAMREAQPHRVSVGRAR